MHKHLCERQNSLKYKFSLHFINDAIPRQKKIFLRYREGLQKQQERESHRREGEHEFHLNRMDR